MTRVLVTGGRGFIGTNLINSLSRLEYEIVNDDVSSSFTSPYDDGPSVDVTNREEIDGAVAESELVVHLAARKGSWFCDADMMDTVRVNLLGALNVARACERSRVPLIYFGTTAFLDSTDQRIMHDEQSHCYPQTIYGATKLAAEQSIGLCDIRYMVIRPVYAYGNIGQHAASRSESWPDVILREMYAGRKDPLQTDLGGEFIKDYTHIGDIIFATVQLMHMFVRGDIPSGDVVQVGAGGNYRFSDVVEAFSPQFDVLYDPDRDYKRHQAHHYSHLRDLIGGWQPIDILEYGRTEGRKTTTWSS